MEINITGKWEEKSLIIALTGRLNNNTAPELSAYLSDNLQRAAALVLDLAGLEYLSSAGLRVILSASKRLSAQGAELRIVNVREVVMEVFEITGFVDILSIERA